MNIRKIVSSVLVFCISFGNPVWASGMHAAMDCGPAIQRALAVESFNTQAIVPRLSWAYRVHSFLPGFRMLGDMLLNRASNQSLSLSEALHHARQFVGIDFIRGFHRPLNPFALWSYVHLMGGPFHLLVQNFEILRYGSEEYQQTVAALRINHDLSRYSELQTLYNRLKQQNSTDPRLKDLRDILRNKQYNGLLVKEGDRKSNRKGKIPINRRTWEGRDDGTYDPILDEIRRIRAESDRHIYIDDWAVSDGITSMELAKRLEAEGLADQVTIRAYDSALCFWVTDQMVDDYQLIFDSQGHLIQAVPNTPGRLWVRWTLADYLPHKVRDRLEQWMSTRGNTLVGRERFPLQDRMMMEALERRFMQARKGRDSSLQRVSLLDPEVEAYWQSHPRLLTFSEQDIRHPPFRSSPGEQTSIVRIMGLLMRNKEYFNDTTIKTILANLARQSFPEQDGLLLNGVLGSIKAPDVLFLDVYRFSGESLDLVDHTGYPTSRGWDRIHLSDYPHALPPPGARPLPSDFGEKGRPYTNSDHDAGPSPSVYRTTQGSWTNSLASRFHRHPQLVMTSLLILAMILMISFPLAPHAIAHTALHPIVSHTVHHVAQSIPIFSVPSGIQHLPTVNDYTEIPAYLNHLVQNIEKGNDGFSQHLYYLTKALGHTPSHQDVVHYVQHLPMLRVHVTHTDGQPLHDLAQKILILDHQMYQPGIIPHFSNQDIESMTRVIQATNPHGIVGHYVWVPEFYKPHLNIITNPNIVHWRTLSHVPPHPVAPGQPGYPFSPHFPPVLHAPIAGPLAPASHPTAPPVPSTHAPAPHPSTPPKSWVQSWKEHLPQWASFGISERNNYLSTLVGCLVGLMLFRQRPIGENPDYVYSTLVNRRFDNGFKLFIGFWFYLLVLAPVQLTPIVLTSWILHGLIGLLIVGLHHWLEISQKSLTRPRPAELEPWWDLLEKPEPVRPESLNDIFNDLIPVLAQNAYDPQKHPGNKESLKQFGRFHEGLMYLSESSIHKIDEQLARVTEEDERQSLHLSRLQMLQLFKYATASRVVGDLLYTIAEFQGYKFVKYFGQLPFTRGKQFISTRLESLALEPLGIMAEIRQVQHSLPESLGKMFNAGNGLLENLFVKPGEIQETTLTKVRTIFQNRPDIYMGNEARKGDREIWGRLLGITSWILLFLSLILIPSSPNWFFFLRLWISAFSIPIAWYEIFSSRKALAYRINFFRERISRLEQRHNIHLPEDVSYRDVGRKILLNQILSAAQPKGPLSPGSTNRPYPLDLILVTVRDPAIQQAFQQELAKWPDITKLPIYFINQQTHHTADMLQAHAYMKGHWSEIQQDLNSRGLHLPPMSQARIGILVASGAKEDSPFYPLIHTGITYDQNQKPMKGTFTSDTDKDMVSGIFNILNLLHHARGIPDRDPCYLVGNAHNIYLAPFMRDIQSRGRDAGAVPFIITTAHVSANEVDQANQYNPQIDPLAVGGIDVAVPERDYNAPEDHLAPYTLRGIYAGSAAIYEAEKIIRSDRLVNPTQRDIRSHLGVTTLSIMTASSQDTTRIEFEGQSYTPYEMSLVILDGIAALGTQFAGELATLAQQTGDPRLNYFALKIRAHLLIALVRILRGQQFAMGDFRDANIAEFDAIMNQLNPTKAPPASSTQSIPFPAQDPYADLRRRIENFYQELSKYEKALKQIVEFSVYEPGQDYLQLLYDPATKTNILEEIKRICDAPDYIPIQPSPQAAGEPVTASSAQNPQATPQSARSTVTPAVPPAARRSIFQRWAKWKTGQHLRLAQQDLDHLEGDITHPSGPVTVLMIEQWQLQLTTVRAALQRQPALLAALHDSIARVEQLIQNRQATFLQAGQGSLRQAA